MIRISFAITACNEYQELFTLINKLLPKMYPEDEIVVLLDSDTASDPVKALCKDFSPIRNFHYYFHSLNKNFAEHKNFLNSKCTNDWIFNIDADEYPSDGLLNNIRSILQLNDDTGLDMIAVPRVNIVNGLTLGHISKWGWKVDDLNRVNWPDYQLRIYKNKPEIKWEGKVHERPVGYKYITSFPEDSDEYTLIHVKDIERQEKQNSFYDTIHA